MNKCKIRMEGFRGRIHTLGDTNTGITCSLFAAKNIFPNASLSGYSSFEEAAASLMEGEDDLMLLPAAYPRANVFLMDEHLALVGATTFEIPALVACGGQGATHYKKLFHHPATRSFLPTLSCFTYDEAVEVSSNEEAVLRMNESRTRHAAVTNRLVADYFHLPIHQVLRRQRDMAWLLFAREEPECSESRLSS